MAKCNQLTPLPLKRLKSKHHTTRHNTDVHRKDHLAVVYMCEPMTLTTVKHQISISADTVQCKVYATVNNLDLADNNFIIQCNWQWNTIVARHYARHVSALSIPLYAGLLLFWAEHDSLLAAGMCYFIKGERLSLNYWVEKGECRCMRTADYFA